MMSLMPASNTRSNQSGFAHLLLILVLVASIAIGVYLVLQRTNLRSRAAVEPPETSLTLVGRYNNDDNIVKPTAGTSNPVGGQGESINVAPDGTFYVDLLVKSNIEAVNLISASIQYPKDLIKVVSMKLRPADVLGLQSELAQSIPVRPIDQLKKTAYDIYDNFVRPDSDSLGYAVTNQPWISYQSKWGIENNNAYISSSCPAPGYAVAEGGFYNGVYSVTFDRTYQDARVPFRFMNPDNMYWFEVKGDGFSIEKRVSGVSSVVKFVNGTYTNGRNMVTIEMYGDLVKVSFNDQPIMEVTAGDVLGTKYGIGTWCDTQTRFKFVSFKPQMEAMPYPTPQVTASPSGQPISDPVSQVPHYFIQTWIENIFDNQTGSIKLTGGIPDPGMKNNVGDYGLMARFKFQALPGTNGKTGKIEFLENGTELYKNSDNLILAPVIKRNLTVNINNQSGSTVVNTTATQPTPTPTPIPTAVAVAAQPVLSPDLNKNNKADLGDISVFLSRFKGNGGNAGTIDLDGNKVLNTRDFSLIIRYLQDNKVIRR